MSHLDHVAISTADYAVSLAFYEAALAPLGIKLTGGRVHIALAAATRAQVDAFYTAAMAAGGKDNGPPGLRPHYHATHYAAFVFDPDGHNIEAVCHGPE